MKHTELAVHAAKHCYAVVLEDQDVHYVKIILLSLSQDELKVCTSLIFVQCITFPHS